MITLSIDIPKDLSNKLNRILSEELNKCSKELGKYLSDYAKKNHRFDTKSGKLVSSIKYKGTLQTGLEIYLDLSIADYGEYIVKGQKTWKSDNFIEQTLIDNESYIIQKIKTAIDIAITRFNNGVY